MMKHILLISLTVFVCSSTFAQVPMATQVQILRAEDARDFDAIEKLLYQCDHCRFQERAVLAAGRIGDERALPSLTNHLKRGYEDLRVVSAFAIGEIESIKAADAILRALGTGSVPVGGTPPKLSESSRVLTRVAGNGTTAGAVRAESSPVTARLLEAAGKIAAANPNDPKSKELGAAMVKVLSEEETKRTAPNTEIIRLGLTAVLRARPAGSEETVRKFLAFTDPNIVADALNTLARLRAKNANRDARDLLATHVHAIVRANAARVLGASEDKEAVDVLIKAATSDSDSRVRVAAIRSLAALKDAKAADPLLTHAEQLLAKYTAAKKPNFIPNETSEFIEVAAALGRIIPNTDNQRADKLFADLAKLDKGHSPEVYIARIRIGQKRGDGTSPELVDWRQYSSLAQVVGEFAVIEPVSEVGKQMKAEAPNVFRPLVKAFVEADPATEGKRMMAGADALQAYARFKTADLGELARTALLNKDVQMRAAAAGILADLPASTETIAALNKAFEYGRVNDVESNDAILATLDALIKLAPTGDGWAEAMGRSIISPDHLVRQKVRAVLPAELKAKTSHQLLYEVTPYLGKGTKMGQVLNTDVDYRRALSRKNGTVKAVLTTAKGTFMIDLLPDDAPLTVDNFIQLARSGYFNGLEVHRVVPNFVMQDGDPRGDGNGGPGWTIRCEVNMVPYERGAVGMALSGKDTGGSQWFVTHSPQPHLDGGYTVFGRVNETGMKFVDNIVRGDKILSVRIVGR